MTVTRTGAGALRATHVGQRVLLEGWVARRRDMGGIAFFDLRDRSGVAQVVVRPDDFPEVAAALGPARLEWVVRVEGRVVEPAELKALADLPSKEGLRAQLVGALQGPLSQLVSLLAAPQRELVRILEARSKQTEATKS